MIVIIKILQWNILYKENPHNIAKVTKQFNPDIVCLQELTTTSLINKNTDVPQIVSSALSHADFNYKQAQSWNYADDVRSLGNGIFSKLPIARKWFKYLQIPTINPTDPSKEGRVYVEITITVNGKLLTVGTVHLSYTHRFVHTESKETEVNNLLQIIKRRRKKYILTGDFNATPDSYTVQNVGKFLVNCGPEFTRNTWTTKPFVEEDFTEDKLNWRLDYAFATKDIKVLNSEVLETEYSDHLPLLILVEI